MARPGTLLITGASGYLGSCLSRRAPKAWRVIAAYHSKAVTLPGCEAVALDVRDSPAVAHLMAQVKPEVVIHAAADMSSPAAMQQVIVEGTRHVAAAAAAVGACLIHLSTDALFDGEHAPYVESDPPSPITPYGRAKAAAEQAAASASQRLAVVRTSLIYGFDPPDPRTRWVIESIRDKKPITLFTDEVRSPIWVEQLASALLELAAIGAEGMWHVAGPQALSRYQFGERLACACGLESAGITPGLSRDSGRLRPRNCTLRIDKAQKHLRSPLWGVDAVLLHVHAYLAGQMLNKYFQTSAPEGGNGDSRPTQAHS